MLKRLAILCLLAAAAVSAVAAKRITSDQLLQLLTASKEAHRTDEAVVKLLIDTELGARLSPAQFDQMVAVSPGLKTTQLLRTMADASLFLDPLPSEIPATPAPDKDAQKSMLEATIHYVARTMPAMPNFIATRETAHFDDTEQVLVKGEWPVRAGLHLVGTSHIGIAFQDGRESDDPGLAIARASGKKDSLSINSKKADAIKDTGQGLYSWGEFGQILGIVLVDAAKGKMEWSHWETMNGKPVAVFKFGVDRTISHYNVQFCCVTSSEVVNGTYGDTSLQRNGGHGNGTGAISGLVKNGDAVVVHQVAGYHGQLMLDPDTGTIWRITLQLDTRPDAPLQRGAMMVEYGPVKISGGTYICPTRSVSISTTNTSYDSGRISQVKAPQVLMLNEVAFTNYHHFGTETKLVNNPAPPASGAPAQVAQEGPTSAAEAAAEKADAELAAAAADTSSETVAVSGTAAAPGAPATADAKNTSAEEDAEILVRAVNEMPGLSDEENAAEAGAGTAAKNGNFTLKATTRLVNVGLVATDKHGKPVTDLKLDEIEVYDNGRKQQPRAFHHAATEAPAAPAPSPATPEITFTNSDREVQTVENVPDTLILLLDESHIGFQDLTRARQEVIRFIQAARSNSYVALYSMGEHGFHVIQDITQDHALLTAKLSAWMPSASSISQAQQLDRRNYQQFDTVQSQLDLNSVNGNITQTPDTFQTSDPDLRQLGDNPLRQSLECMTVLTRHFASVPGHKSLVWISGDSALVDWEDRAVGMEKGSKQLDAVFARAREALNEAHIALYAVDASQVLGGQTDASLANQNVKLSAIATDNLSAYGPPPPRINTDGRIAGQMQTDTRGIQGPIRQLAESTGGRAVNRGSDLAKTLGGIEEDLRGLYEVGFDPDTQPDGKFHTLQLKIPDRKDIKLRYRTEYMYSEELASTKERFQQAVWSPQDATAVGLTAEAVPATNPGDPSTVKLRITFKGLALQPEAGGRWSDKLYIFVAQRDDATQKAEVSGDTLRLSLKPETYDTGMPAGIPYHRDVDIKSKLGTVRVIVVDGNSGRMGSVTLPASSLHP